ncbi:MAG: hypothetical protein ACI9VR_000472 [Cognaticolwellia sp.]|jgi:hypothetical protein
MTPWMLVTVPFAHVAYAQDAENADGAQTAPEASAAETSPAETSPAKVTSSETVADPGAIPQGGFIGNDSYGAIPVGSGWGYVWAVYIATWLTMLGYAGYLALRKRSTT